ncbi:hypothetical protein [Actinopolyspora lacussalsi]|uniref:hypothetical protein n=1 Tax=Actinopolyspora righensis TaxID=995060 RepID=UPI001FE77870|nr:hypothetical protein [Actinopolyspora righensis]
MSGILPRVSAVRDGLSRRARPLRSASFSSVEQLSSCLQEQCLVDRFVWDAHRGLASCCVLCGKVTADLFRRLFLVESLVDRLMQLGVCFRFPRFGEFRLFLGTLLRRHRVIVGVPAVASYFPRYYRRMSSEFGCDIPMRHLTRDSTGNGFPLFEKIDLSRATQTTFHDRLLDYLT